MDPTDDERVPTLAGIAAARAFLARRFPALRGAPLVGTEVCQYESTPDSHFIIDRHPDDPRIRIAGGGSGHGFKMGPADRRDDRRRWCSATPCPTRRLALARFPAPPAEG